MPAGFERSTAVVTYTVTDGQESDTGVVLVHVLDLADEAGLVADIKRRYEHPLMEIFP